MPEDRSLYPGDLRNYFKRLRHNFKPARFRYFAAGEYGEKSGHPHYHIALFGVAGCARGVTRVTRDGKSCCTICDTHAKTWGKGYAFVGELTSQSAAYICGYVVKKWSRKGGEEDTGKHPEFARMSNKPGIGAWFADEVASTIMEHRLEDTILDVPLVLRHGKKMYPLGTYLRRAIRKRIGRDQNAPKEVYDQIERELQPVREAAHAIALPGQKELAFRQALIAAQEGQTLRLELLQRVRKTHEKV